jgi:hypothetical protein
MDEDIVTSSGILAFLADRFNVRSREEFATEGLGYLLQATASDVRISKEFWDWYGGKVSLPEPAGGLLAVSFDPLLWGQDDASTPLRLSFLTRGLPWGTIDLLYPVYLRMIVRADESLRKLGAGSATPSERSDDWWVAPFPLRAGLAGEEAREDMTRSAADLLKPLLDLIAPHP